MSRAARAMLLIDAMDGKEREEFFDRYRGQYCERCGEKLPPPPTKVKSMMKSVTVAELGSEHNCPYEDPAMDAEIGRNIASALVEVLEKNASKLDGEILSFSLNAKKEEESAVLHDLKSWIIDDGDDEDDEEDEDEDGDDGEEEDDGDE